MRTQKLLVAAAVLAISAATSVAQVYSLNIVGYVNLTFPANSYSLVANPLDATTNTLATVLTNAPAGLAVLSWTGSGYAEYDAVAPGSGFSWYDVGNDASGDNTPIPPGVGFFVHNTSGSPISMTMVGSVRTGTNVTSLPSGYGLVSSVYPIATNLSGMNLTQSVTASTAVLTWNGGGYSEFDRLPDGTWYDVGNDAIAQPTINVGQGFFLRNPGSSVSWTNVFNP